MKLSFITLMLAFLQVSASSYAQKVTIQVKDAGANEVFYKLTQQTGYTFTADATLIKKLKPINLNMSNATLKEVLDKCFEGYDVKVVFNEEDKIVVIKANNSNKITVQPPVNITGKITDKKGDALPGVTVTIKGTTKGTMTDADGNYTFSNVPSDATLVFSLIGMLTQEVSVNGKSLVNVVMVESPIGLNEVVAIGYGTQKKSDLTGAVVSINAEEISQSQSTNFLSAMQGRMAGVNISSESGEPGSGINIQIRGANSIYGSSSPLFVIDGIQVELNKDEVATSDVGNSSTMNPLSNLNPADIESIEVLKDASATSIFGSRGANGVVIVTTKSGKKGKSTIEYNGSTGISDVANTLDVLNASDYLVYQELRGSTAFLMKDTDGDGSPDTRRDFENMNSHDWQKELFRTALSQNHSLSASGSNGKTGYSASVGYTSEKGIVKKNDYDRYNFRLKLNHQQSDKFSLKFNINGSLSESNGAVNSGGTSGGYNGVLQYVLIANPWEVNDPDIDNSAERYISPMSMIDEAQKTTRLMRIIGGVEAEYKITKRLSLSSLLGTNYTDSKLKEFYNSKTIWGHSYNGKAGIKEVNSYSYNNSTKLNYSNTINKKHKINLMGAFEVDHYAYEDFQNQITNFQDQSTGYNDISKGSVLSAYNTGKWTTNRLSYLARANYTYNNRYLFTASFRADGSDKFGADNRWGYFPSTAFAWRASEERFFKQFSKLSNLKLRLSYGETGNERIPAYSQFAKMENAYYASNDVLMFGMAPASKENPDLKWESTTQYNAGIDIGLFNERISLNVDYYLKQTKDMLLDAPVAAQSGFNTQWKNIGRIDNKGLEVFLSTVNISKRNFTWKSTFNISFNRNEVIDMGGAEFIPVVLGSDWLTTPGRVIVGQPIGTMYGYQWDGVYQISDFNWQNNNDESIPTKDRIYELKDGVVQFASGTVRPGDLKYKDLGSDNIVDDLNDRTVIGNSNPKHSGGFSNTFKYKDFDFNFFLNWSFGNDIFYAGKFRINGAYSYMNVTQDFFDNHWSETNPTNNYPGIDNIGPLISSYFVEDGSFLRLKTATLGYNMPKQLLKGTGISSARVYVAGTNLWTWTKYNGFDPEVNSNNPLLYGYDRISYPRSRTFYFGVNVTF